MTTLSASSHTTSDGYGDVRTARASSGLGRGGVWRLLSSGADSASAGSAPGSDSRGSTLGIAQVSPTVGRVGFPRIAPRCGFTASHQLLPRASRASAWGAPASRCTAGPGCSGACVGSQGRIRLRMPAPALVSVARFKGDRHEKPSASRLLAERGRNHVMNTGGGATPPPPVTTVTNDLNACLRSFQNRKENAMAHSGRFTSPPVEEAEGLCKRIWRFAWEDGTVTPSEGALMDTCEQVVLVCTVADATEELRNAMSQRNGFEAPNFNRKLRETKERLTRFREQFRPFDPTPPAGPAQAKAA